MPALLEGPVCPETVREVLGSFIRHPWQRLMARWNWKSALLSALLRSQIFLLANLRSGWKAAGSAMLAEFLYRSATAGFWGGITQSFRDARPGWLAAMLVMLIFPLTMHTAEFTVHWLRGTPHLLASMTASVSFTIISVAFQWYAMGRGALRVGAKSQSLAGDFRCLPKVLLGFLTAGPAALRRCLQRG